MEDLLLDLLQHRALLPEFVRDPSYAQRDELLLRKPLGDTQRRLGRTRISG
jgi:glutathione S-transferase